MTTYTTIRGHRIGPKMDEAQDIVRRLPGILAVDIARQVGANGSTFYGYQVVNRAAKAGLIRQINCQKADCRRPAINHRHYVAS